MANFLFWFSWFYITLISSVDVYFAIKYQDVLLGIEKNPIGVFLIKTDGGSVALFMACKLFGTVLALTLLLFLHNFSPKIAKIVIGSMVLFQTGLVIYILFG